MRESTMFGERWRSGLTKMTKIEFSSASQPRCGAIRWLGQDAAILGEAFTASPAQTLPVHAHWHRRRPTAGINGVVNVDVLCCVLLR